MFKKVVAVLTGCVVAGLVGIASAQPGDFDKITGGGQIDVAADGQGAGNTLAFGALESPAGDTGQVQYVGTASAGSGTAPDSWHGRVDCVDVGSGNEGRMSGTATDGETFWIRVIDGDGAPDMIDIEKPSDSDCEEEADDFTEHELGRGNAVVHDAP